MKNQIITVIGLTLLTGLFSCNDQSTTDNNTVTTNGMTIDTSIKMPETIAPTVDPTQISVATPNIPTAAPSSQTTSNTKLNPAHGAPGHDCAIPVGAPLNGAKSATPTATPATATGNAKTNPAHGQPGHDCALPVGAPLKS